MKKAPDPVAIHEAELRFFQSAQLVSGGFCRVRDAFRNSMARPSTMVKVAGLAGLFCFWLARRMRLKSPTPLKSLFFERTVIEFVDQRTQGPTNR